MADTIERGYTVGRQLHLMPIAIVAEAATHVNAGPVLFVVEKRELTDETIAATLLAQRSSQNPVVRADGEDKGLSVHVIDPSSGLEYLRFDCFEHDPHYHYIRHNPLLNIIVQIDRIAEGDPFQWALQHLTYRLPRMLQYAGARTLAEAVTLRQEEVAAGVAKLVPAARELTGTAEYDEVRLTPN